MFSFFVSNVFVLVTAFKMSRCLGRTNLWKRLPSPDWASLSQQLDMTSLTEMAFKVTWDKFNLHDGTTSGINYMISAMDCFKVIFLIYNVYCNTFSINQLMNQSIGNFFLKDNHEILNSRRSRDIVLTMKSLKIISFLDKEIQIVVSSDFLDILQSMSTNVHQDDHVRIVFDERI
jgi:hypothetical protein